jgi:hypothetical protein
MHSQAIEGVDMRKPMAAAGVLLTLFLWVGSGIQSVALYQTQAGKSGAGGTGGYAGAAGSTAGRGGTTSAGGAAGAARVGGSTSAGGSPGRGGTTTVDAGR